MSLSDLPLDVIDQDTFSQILGMDEDDDEHEFSKGLVEEFLGQAVETLAKLDSTLPSANLKELSDLGHFMKGSSAAIGLTKVKNECEKIQNYGLNRNATGSEVEPDSEVCLRGIKDAIAQLKIDYAEAAKVLKDFYDIQD